MYFNTIVAAFFAFGAISTLASPTPIEKREDVSDVLAVVNSLQATTGSILPQIDNLVNSNQATQANLEPLIVQLVGALDSSTASLNALGAVDQSTGGSKDEVASKIATVYSDIARTTNNVKSKKPHYYPLFPKHGLELTLYKLLLGLELVLAGVLKLVAVLLKVVAGLLSGLGWLLITLLLSLHK